MNLGKLFSNPLHFRFWTFTYLASFSHVHKALLSRLYLDLLGPYQQLVSLGYLG